VYYQPGREGVPREAWVLCGNQVAKELYDHMTISNPDVEQAIQGFLTRMGKAPEALTPDLPLYADGIGLDSLETAELSAVLEDEFGTDPYSEGGMPQTVGEILAFYDAASAQA
jgi:acyl carrier protein